MAYKNTKDVYAVILIGGKGKRLRPLSTDAKPKAFLSVTKDRKTMFQRTVLRSQRMVPLDRILVVANKAHHTHIKRNVPGLRKDNIILEPISRNTAPAIAMAARNLERRSRDCVMVVLPTDQYIIDETKYVSAVKRGIDFVKHHDEAIVIFGQKPTYAATGFGYIRVPPTPMLRRAGKGQWSKGKSGDIVRVEEFTEKPDRETAKRYLESGRYLWNMSTFIFKTSTMLRAFKELAPDIFYGLKEKICLALYGKLPDISIDYAIIEKARTVYCVRGNYRWRDMGGFDALRKILKREGRKFVEVDGKITKIL